MGSLGRPVYLSIARKSSHFAGLLTLALALTAREPASLSGWRNEDFDCRVFIYRFRASKGGHASLSFFSLRVRTLVKVAAPWLNASIKRSKSADVD